MSEIIKFILRKILSVGRIRNFYCYLRVIYFCKIKKKLENFENISLYTWKHTLDSNKRAIYDKDINLPKHPDRKNFFDIGRSLGGAKSNLLLEALKKKYKQSDFKNLKILSIGPRSEGEIFNLFANGFELKNITGIDLFSYSPLIQLGDMHDLNFKKEEFDIVLMGWCLAYSNDKKKVLSEVKKVLNSKGIIVIGHTVLINSDDEILKKRGYFVASPFIKINSLEDLDNLANSVGFNKFYSNKFGRKIIYAANK